MPNAAIIASALHTPTPGRAYSLFVAGTDLILGAGSGGNRTGVPLDTIQVTEAGMGGVSSMRFTIEDPPATVTLSEGDEVLYLHQASGIPEFRGYVQRWTSKPFGLGRSIEVECVGVEVLLDWFVIPSLTITAGTYVGGTPTNGVAGLVQRIVSAAVGPPVALNVATGSASAGGNQSFPVGGELLGFTLDVDLVFSGTTLREALRQLADYRQVGTSTATNSMFTIDFWLGLRWVQFNDPLFPNREPADYADLTVLDTPAGTVVAGDLGHEVDAGSLYRGVYVKGGNAAGSGLITDGNPKVGPYAILEDSTILTSAARDAAGLAYLRDKSVSVRGDFNRETFLPTDTVGAHVQVLSNVVLTDAQVGLSSTTYRIMQIDKTYQGGGLETWTITYGGLAPRVERAIRRVTRDIKS